MILLTCDHPRRELRSLNRLKEKLLEQNIKCIIINKALIIKAYNLYKPKLITIPHTLNYLIHPINVLKDKVKIIVIPTESCIMVDKFIKMQYCNIFSNHSKPSNHKKVDYFFTQSKFTSNYLKKNKLIKKNLIPTGFLYFDYWYKKKLNNKIKDNYKKKIGIALTNELPLRFYDSKNFVKNFKKSHESTDYFENKWRLKQFNLDLFILSAIFKLVDKLPKDYQINIRPHPLDSQTKLNEVFRENPNVVIDNNSELQEWICSKDIIISTFSSIYIDTYIFKKPHISLINLIPNIFLNFKAYNSHSYKDYFEFFSNKPKNFNLAIKMIKKIRFQRNIKFEKKILKYYNFPNKKDAASIMSENLIKIHKKENKVFKHIVFNKKQKIMNDFLGVNIASFLMFYLSEIKLYFHPHTNKSYYSKFTFLTMKIPYLIYKLIK